MVSLRDGSRVFVRPVEPSDRALLEQGFERLGPESRYRRFFSPVKRLSEQQLDYLTRIDHHDHEALLAIDERTGEAVAVARYVRVGNGLAEPGDRRHRRLAGPWPCRAAAGAAVSACAGGGCQALRGADPC